MESEVVGETTRTHACDTGSNGERSTARERERERKKDNEDDKTEVLMDRRGGLSSS